MKYFVYVLLSEVKKKSYVGSTNDLSRRLHEHNAGKSITTRRYKPWRVIYTEEYLSAQEARKREKFFKSKSGRRFLRTEVFKN